MAPFDLELREARRIIREHGDNPEDFRITRAPKQTPSGHIHLREYTVNVVRGNVASATYESGPGRNWVVVFAHDLGMRRFATRAKMAAGPGTAR